MGGNVYLGIDLGIGSCGWALATDDGLIALGSRTFDVPETDKDRTPTNQLRRVARGLRRVTARRRQRMNAVRDLLHRHGLLDDAGKQALAATDKVDPWQVRAEGLDRRLSARELAVALGHIAKHRGFKSNSKRDKGANATDDVGKMLTEAAKLQEKEQLWRSVGETFWNDPDLRQRKRNRDGGYDRTVLRADLEREVRLLLRQQRLFGNALATEALEDDFLAVAFFQRPLANSDGKVGPCPFEEGEKRAARHAPSFEMFRLLSRLTALRIDGRPLAPEEIAQATQGFGRQQGITYARLRKVLNLPAQQRFDGVAASDEGARDVVSRSGKAMPGSAALFKVLGEGGWDALRKEPAALDAVAAILTFRDDLAQIRAGLVDVGLDGPLLETVMRGADDGAFNDFKGTGHISAKACRAIIPHLAQGKVYSDACALAGYAHDEQAKAKLDDIANPIARRALGEALKQVNAVIRVHGQPTHIHVELARDIGKSLDERQEIERGIDKRNRQRDLLRQQYRDVVGGEATPEDLLRFELWKEQGGRSLYSDRDIHPALIASTGNQLQVDHILPWSRSGDDSFVNKTLCFTGENQRKRGRTPFEWFAADGLDWGVFSACVENCRDMKGRKKRNYLLKDASVLEQRFKTRNLNDTRYASRLLLTMLRQAYDGVVVAARPGPLTDRLRRAWGLQGLKKDQAGQRVDDDRHHGLDALIVALTSQSMLQRLTKLFQEAEARGFATDWHGIGHLHDLLRDSGGVPADFAALEPPWSGFRDDVIQALAGVTVSRAERRRARGEAHAATIRQVAERDGQAVVYERKAVAALTDKDIDKIKDVDRNHRLVAVLRDWVAAGKPKDCPPISPQGHVLRKVRLETTKKVDVEVRGGAAERGEMARVDVFRKANKKGKWEYYLVPVYPHQVATLDEPPNQAVAAHKPETEWLSMGDEYQFLWSLYPMSWVELVKPDGEVITGYFRGMNRSTGAIGVSPHQTQATTRTGIGVKTLTSFRKFAVDRLGQRNEITRETRTWHGKACI